MLALYRSGRQAEALDVYRHARRELSEQLGLEPGEELTRLEQAILRQDRALALAEEEPRPSPVSETSPRDRSLLIAARGLDGVGALVRLAAPLAASQPPRELVVAAVVETADVGAATAALAERRAALLADGLVVRTVAFSSPSWGRDVVRLASRENVDLLLVQAPRAGFGGDVGAVLDEVPCDVAMLVEGAARRARGRWWSRSAPPGTTGRRSSWARGWRAPATRRCG
jgi:hypothetical protein